MPQWRRMDVAVGPAPPARDGPAREIGAEEFDRLGC